MSCNVFSAVRLGLPSRRQPTRKPHIWRLLNGWVCQFDGTTAAGRTVKVAFETMICERLTNRKPLP